MKITIKYFAQVKKEAGTGTEILELDEGMHLQECLGAVSTNKSKAFREMIYDESGVYRDAVILIINNDQVRYDENPEMKDRDELMIMSPIAGG